MDARKTAAAVHSPWEAFEVYARLEMYADLPVISLGRVPGTTCEVRAILGGSHAGQSFKNLLGLGLLVMARERGLLAPRQPVIESSSGSTLEGLAQAGRLLGHPVTGVSDPSLPWITAHKAETMGARVIRVQEPHPVLGWQQAREDRVREELAANSDLHWTDQNNSPFNPGTYTRWLVPALEQRIDPRNVTASIFVVGSGGHFSALSEWLKTRNSDVRTLAADREGSITFGGDPGTSFVRGVGNSNIVPEVLDGYRSLVEGVITVSDEEAFLHCRRLAESGLFVGGSSGLAYAAALRVAKGIKRGIVLTMFPDRGELYFETIGNDQWMREHGFRTC